MSTVQNTNATPPAQNYPSDRSALPVLAPKLQPPRLPSTLVERARLLQRLDSGLAEHKVTLLCAPAGFGKTTLLTQWISACQHTQVSWITLDVGDNDPARFWNYIIAACQDSREGLGISAQNHLRDLGRPWHRESPSPVEAFLTELLNDIGTRPGRFVLVLEDYHTITTQQIHTALSRFIEHLPPTLHLIITTRNSPPLSLAKLRASNGLLELNGKDLRFSQQEIEALLLQSVPFALSKEARAHLETHTEGWGAGLRLAVLALRERTAQESERFLTTFIGSQRSIRDYVITEVLDAQSAEVQHFLLRTSGLESLCGSLCDAVTAGTGGALLLEALEQANLFLVPLEGCGQTEQWYRYHTLFSEALQHEAQRRLPADLLLVSARAASEWYEHHSMYAEAVEASLSIEDFGRVADLLEKIVERHETFLGHGKITMERWITALPREIQHAHPSLCLVYAMIILFTSDRHAPETKARLEEPLSVAERYYIDIGDPAKQGAILGFRSLVEWWQGNYKAAFQATKAALALLPESEREWRGICLVKLGVEAMREGRLDDALSALTQGRAICKATGNIHPTLASTIQIATIYFWQGELYQAKYFFEQVLQETTPEKLLDDRGYALLGLGRLSYEWNDLEDAERRGIEARAIAERIKNGPLEARAELLLAELQAARGEVKQALQRVLRLVPRIHSAELRREIQCSQAHLSLKMGALGAWERWSAQEHGDDEISLIQREEEELLAVRLRHARGEVDLQALENWQARASAQGRLRVSLQVQILLAVCYAERKERGRASQELKEALLLAQVADHRRLFLDEGTALLEPLRDVLQDVREEPLYSYTRSLLLKLTEPQTEKAMRASIDVLSPQELRVLRLLADGCSKPEIAETLVVSINTVKTQVRTIYRKLHVHGRKDAQDVARRLRLL